MALAMNEATWYSKLAAIILFLLVLPILTFYIGRVYERTVNELDRSPAAAAYGMGRLDIDSI